VEMRQVHVSRLDGVHHVSSGDQAAHRVAGSYSAGRYERRALALDEDQKSHATLPAWGSRLIGRARQVGDRATVRRPEEP